MDPDKIEPVATVSQPTPRNYSTFIKSFIAYFVIGAAFHLIFALALPINEIQSPIVFFSNVPFITIFSIWAPFFLASFSGDGQGIVTLLLTLLLQISLLSAIPFLILQKQLPPQRFRLLIIFLLVLVAWPFIAKALYSPIGHLIQTNNYESSQEEYKQSQEKYKDIPIKIVEDKLVEVERYGLGYALNKKLEVTVQIDSPVSAEKVNTDCSLFEVVDTDKYRMVTTSSYPVAYEGKFQGFPLQQGKNVVKYQFTFQDVQDLAGKPKDYEEEALSSSYLFRDGPYRVMCRMTSLYVNDDFYQTLSSEPTLEYSALSSGYNNFKNSKPMAGSVNSGLYTTGAFKKSEFFAPEE